MSDYYIYSDNLTKEYNGDIVVDNINMHIKKGEIYGFIGKNGAGKSTTFKMFLNIVKATSGCFYINGEEMNSKNIHLLKKIGSIIESPFFYDKLTAKENLYIHCKYMNVNVSDKEIEEMIDYVGLKNINNKPISKFSLGMKQRLALARAMITKPDILLLDEPINGLDPVGISEIRNLLKSYNKKYNTTIIISSHILAEMQNLVDTVGIMKDGKLIKETSFKEITSSNKYTNLEDYFFEMLSAK